MGRAVDAGVEAVWEALQANRDKGRPLQTRVDLARALGISKQAICQWVRVPAEHTIGVESLLGVPRHVLRPDLYMSAAELAAEKRRIRNEYEARFGALNEGRDPKSPGRKG